MSRKRVAVGGLFIECNHFGGQPSDLACFERMELRRGTEALEISAGTVGGALRTLRTQGAEAVPLLVTSAYSGGPVTPDCYAVLKGEILERLRAALPLDGVLLTLHGSGAVAGMGHLESDLLPAVRELVGPTLPVVATLDLHAHVTEAMIHAATALVAWETYPHKDAFTTGERAANLLCATIAGRYRPVMALAKAPVLVSGINGHTEGPGPFADVMRFAKGQEGQGGVVSTSVFLVHPYLDLPDMGGGGLVVTDGDPVRAAALARAIALQYWERRLDFDPPVFAPAEAIRRGLAVAGGPVLLVETADCVGGGAAGDSVATLKALLAENLPGLALAPVVDPSVAAECHRAGVGATLNVEVGHRVDPRWGEPVKLTARIARLSDGRFTYNGGIWEGQLGEMGPSAVLECGQVRILVTSHGAYDWADEQFRVVGLETHAAKFVVVKNPMNYRLGYADMAKAAFILDTPGPTPAVLHHVQYQRLHRPYYPADRDISDFQPRVTVNSSLAEIGL